MPSGGSAVRGERVERYPLAAIAVLLDAGDEVLTAKQGTNGITLGDAVGAELRIAHNGEKYRISDMPDE